MVEYYGQVLETTLITIIFLLHFSNPTKKSTKPLKRSCDIMSSDHKLIKASRKTSKYYHYEF
jgi:hypothetical protein